jgi:hypothetical protein
MYFQILLKEDNRSTIDAIIHLFGFFPIFIELEYIQSLMAKVRHEELLKNIQRFQRDKSPGLDGILIDFFLIYFYFIGSNLRRTMEHSITYRKTLKTFKSTFTSLIPKVDNPTRYEVFILISLCNTIYRII